ncbi:MAG TPA: hypothetical protein DCM28_06395 [Phycisphaerales bacterium]|nr:hypothetical protein [Phycisphaerales bacterium]|tara:strand:- start:2484 stop:2990 length:507 start_codon:yes stop_codon:yes gene_type:complete
MHKLIPILIVALSASFAFADVIEIEAEAAEVDASNIVESEKASGGKVVSFTKQTKASKLTFEFEVPADGEYQLWANAFGASGNADSFYVQLDKGERETWDTVGRALTMQPIRKRITLENNKLKAEAWVTELTKGKHTLVVSRREAGAVLDKIFIAPKDVDMKSYAKKK